MQNLEKEKYRYLLIQVFESRCAINPQYSLRSFAKSLNFSHTTLSLLFSGKRQISQKIISHMNDELGLVLPKAEESFSTLNLDCFEQIATWIHYAILGLISLPSFKPTGAFLGKRLGLKSDKALRAFEDLKFYQYIEYINGKWQQKPAPLAVDVGKSSQIAKDFIRGMMVKSEESLNTVDIDERDMTTITFPMRREDVIQAKEQIKKFRRNLCQMFEKSELADDVYNLSIQLFPLTEKSNS